MKGLAVALGGILATTALAIGLSSTAYGATGQVHHAAAASHPPSMSNPTSTNVVATGCTDEEYHEVNNAVLDAETYATDADAYLTAHSAATKRYTAWFGAYTASRKSTVSSHFRSIKQTDFNALTYDCTCQQPKMGYVNPGQADHVFLCQSFWHAPTNGTDSMAGTLVNLVGQFTKNGGLRESVQGQAACETLAKNNPDQAVMNADSYEYFAEDNPPLA